MRVPRTWLTGSLCAWLLPVTAGAADGVRILAPPAAAAARGAIQGATRRLAHSRCLRLLKEFTDGSGRPLEAVLEDKGQTAQSHLDQLLFYDGTVEGRCRDARVMAYTAPESAVVFICGARFAQEHRRAPAETEAIVIHEMLHTLGLGENPPTPYQITSRVFSRCMP